MALNEERLAAVSIYDIHEPQNGYDHNGVAVLMPSEVTSDKEDKGRWEINIRHPIDDYGKWTYIIGQNVVKVNGQLFRIDETEIYHDAEQEYIAAHAKHITYDLNDRFVDDLSISTDSGNSFIDQVIRRSSELLPTQHPTPDEYTFHITSDITGELNSNIHDQTVIGALFGDDNSLAVQYGGELYRDNFHISINRTMENLPASPAFIIRYGTDMTKISYKIDFSSWITELICVDDLGDVWAVSYVGSEWIIHHHKTKRVHFVYPADDPNTFDRLVRDGAAYWESVNTPTVSIEVSVANIRDDPKYKDFIDLQKLDVGYTGRIYFEQLGIDVEMKIVSMRKNELTGEAIQIVLGNSRGSFIRSPVMSQTIVGNDTVASTQQRNMRQMENEIENANLRLMRTWGGLKSFTWSAVKKYTWREIINGRKNN